VLLALHLEGLEGSLHLLVHGELHGSMRREEERGHEAAVETSQTLLSEYNTHSIYRHIYMHT
jgi:hypothetical protein